jgi:hypothetical protein
VTDDVDTVARMTQHPFAPFVAKLDRADETMRAFDEELARVSHAKPPCMCLTGRALAMGKEREEVSYFLRKK